VTRGPRIVNTRTRAEMKKILKEIQSGRFAKEWVAESEAGRANFNALRDAGARHQIEEVGAQLRSMMPFLAAGKQKVSDVSGG
jgi:ketol-acid reductoisomerase